jgi:hypothetical protein
MSGPNGVVLWEGASLIDGAPIVVIATGIEDASTNGKTGPMVQTWILRSDIAPGRAIHTGDDASVCGACPHRGTIVDGVNVGRTCYVTIWQAPRNVYESFHRGIYPRVTIAEATVLLSGKRVRLGAYGNPSAAPLPMWRKVTRLAYGRTGYIHNWRNAARGWRDLVMASVENAAEALEAQAMGYRTFRVRGKGEALATREVACPASKEAGYKTSCFDCMACGGLAAKAKVNIAIVVHGAGAGTFERARA